MAFSLDGRRLAPLLSPRSIAFVGASVRPNTPGNDMMRMIRRGGFAGLVHAVNPGHREIEGYPCVPGLADLPAAPDLVVLSVRNERLEETLGGAIARGAKAAVVFASGVLPGERDDPLARRLARAAAEAALPVCGPNCMGFYNDLDRVWVCGFPSPRQPAPGGIAFIAHSGSVFGALAHNDPRLRFALAVSPGGEATATVADYIAYAVERPEVRVVGLFIETARDPERFALALEQAAERGVPVVALKVGRTAAAAAAALTHTGALAGSDLAYDALFDRYGVDPGRDARRTRHNAAAAVHGAPRRARRPCRDRRFRRRTRIADRSGGSRRRPVRRDLERDQGLDRRPAGAGPRSRQSARRLGYGADFVATFTNGLGDLLADPEAALGLFSADIRDGYYLHRGFADAALAAARESDKIVAVATNYTQVRHDALALELTLAGIPVLDGTANALAAVRGALSYRDFRARPDDPPPLPPAARAADRQAARARLREATGPLDEAASLSLLEAWGLPAIPHVVVESPAEARLAGAKLGYPVACKTATSGILHKSDVGGVRLDLANDEALLEAYRDLAGRLGPRALIAPMAKRGVELSLGMIRDPQFGPIVVVGAGGVLIELIDDRRAALAPFGRATACRLLDGLKIRRLLDGYRGVAAVDIDSLADIVALFSVLAADLADLVAEIDINPLIAGRDIVALDALVIAQPGPS